MNDIDSLILSGGLPSLTSEQNPDYQAWRDRNNDYFIEHNIGESDIQTIYRNRVFINRFGQGVYDITPLDRIDNILERDVLENHINNRYANDPRREEILELTPAGQREAIEQYMPEEEYRRSIEEDIRERHNNLPMEHMGHYVFSESFESSVRLDENDNALNRIIEEDKQRKLEIVSDDVLAIRSNYIDNYTPEQVEEAFERIASGWTENIETPDGRRATYAIPGSRYYEVFKESEWLDDLDYNDKLEYLSNYQAILNTFGINQALYYLDSSLQNRIAEKQGFGTTLGKTLWQMIGTGVVPDLLSTAIIAGGIVSSNPLDPNKNLSDILNSDAVQYLDKVSRYGTWDTELIEEAEANGGLSQRKPVWTVDQENSWISGKTFYDVAEQSKWMIEMLATSALTGGLGGLASKGLSATTKAARAAVNTSRAVRAIDAVEDVAMGAGRLLRLAVDASPITTREALGAFNETRDANNAIIDSRIQDSAVSNAEELIANDTEIQRNIEILADQYIDRYLEQHPSLSRDDVDRTTFLNDARQDYLYVLTEENRENLESSYSEERERALLYAADAFKTTFFLSTLKTSISNIGFRRFMYEASFRNAFRVKRPNSNIRVNSAGYAERIPMTRWQKYGEPVFRNTLGEGFDEALDGIISGFGTGYGQGKFQHYLDATNENGGLNYFAAGILGGLSSTWETLGEESLYREAFLGALGGTFSISPSFRFTKKEDPINGKSYSILERIDRFITNPIIHDIVENKRLEVQTQQRVDNINKVLQRYANSYNSISNIMTSINALSASKSTGSAEEILNLRQEAATDLMLGLFNLSEDKSVSSSSIVTKTRKAIKEAADGNISDEEVNEFLSQPGNKHLRDKMSPADVKSRIQENAQKLLDTEKQIIESRKKLSKYTAFERASQEVQDYLVKNDIAVSNFRSRIASIRKEMQLTANPTSEIVIGSKQHLEVRKRAIEEALEKTNKKIEETKALTKDDYKKASIKEGDVTSSRGKRLLLKELKKNEAKLRKELSILNSIEFDENGYTKLKTAEEILTLDSKSLMEMFDKNNSKYFSKEQRAAIREAKSILNKRIKKSSLDVNYPSDKYDSTSTYYASTLASLEENAEIGERIVDMFLEDQFDILPLENLWQSREIEPDTYIDKQFLFNDWDSKFITSDGKLVNKIKKKDINKLLISKDTKALKEYVEQLKSRYPDYNGIAISQLNTVVVKSEIINQLAYLLWASNNIKHLPFLINFVTNTDFNNIEEFIQKIKELLNSSNILDEHKEAIKEILKAIETLQKTDDSTVLIESSKKQKIEEKDKKEVSKESKESKNNNKNNKEEQTSRSSIEESESVESLEKNEEQEILDSEESIENIDNYSSRLEAPIDNSKLPTDNIEDTVDKNEIQGNRVYKYDGEALRENKKQIVRSAENEGDTHDLVSKWLSNRGIKLQEFIDNELASIAKLNPKVFFMMPNTTEFDSDGSPVYNKDANPFLNAMFQVIEYTDEIKKIHNEEYGKPIYIGNKPYLVIGVSGYNPSNKAEETAYNRIVDSTKRVRYATTKRIKSEGKRIPEFVINPTIYTEIKDIQAGWVVKQMVKDEEVKERPLTELIEDKERNPHGITLQNSKWLIQEKSKTVTIRVDKSDVVHSPSDVESNLGSVFLLVPAANGHLVPISFKVRMLKDLKEGSTLRTAITEEILKLTRMDTREEGLSNLLDLLLLSKDGDSLFFDKDALEDNILIVKRKGVVIKEIDLRANDVTTQLEELFFGETSTFKLNINVRVLSDPTQLRIYSESGALYTDAALLGTSNASYTVRALDEDYKPIQDPEPTVNSSSSRFKGDYTNSQSRVMTYLGRRYTEREGEFYDSNGNLVTRQSHKQELLYAKWIEETNPTPSHGNVSVKVYIYSTDKSNPIVIRQYSSGRISILSKENALREIIKQEEEIAKQKREEEAKKALERVEQTFTTVEDESETIEGTTSIDDLFAEIEQSLPKENTTETVEEVETPKSTTDNNVLSDGVPVEELNSTSDVVTYLFSGQAEGESIEALEDLLIDKGLETEEDVRKYLDKNNISIVGIKSEDIGSLLEILKHCKE